MGRPKFNRTKSEFIGYNMPRELKTEEDEKAIKEWLKNNKITVCPPCTTTDPEEITYTYKAGKRK